MQNFFFFFTPRSVSLLGYTRLTLVLQADRNTNDGDPRPLMMNQRKLSGKAKAPLSKDLADRPTDIIASR